MAFTAVRTFVTGDNVSAAQMNIFVRDNIGYVMNSVYKGAFKSAHATYTASFPIGTTEFAVAGFSWPSPNYPDALYAAVVWGWFWAVVAPSGGTTSDITFYFRDATNNLFGFSSWRLTSGTERYNIGRVDTQYDLDGNAGGVTYNFVANQSDTWTINYANTGTYLGYMLIPYI